MRKYYTRPCNFQYGNYAKKLIKNKKALPVAGNPNISFDEIEIFERKKRGIIKNYIYKISELKFLSKDKKVKINSDIQKIVLKRKSIAGLNFNIPNIMGVLNITPDSFSDGGQFLNETKAFNQAKLMLKSGARIIDIGGESTRPGSSVVEKKAEWKRVEKIIKKMKKNFPKVPLSLDTRKSYVMEKGIDNQVNIINDVSGLNFDTNSFNLINSNKIPFILNHMQGLPSTMQKKPKYEDALLDIFDFFEEKINFCKKKKYKHEFIILDPGIGFGKNLNHNLRIMSKISTFHSLGCPILLGTSKKNL